MLSNDIFLAPQRALRDNRPEGAARLASSIAFYEAHARDYAATTARIDTFERLSQFAALLPSGGRVLDAGCGAGRDLLHFHTLGFQATGVDMSVNLAEIARHHSGCEVLVGDLLEPPCLAPFDGIWAMASLLHLDRQQIGIARAAQASLLKPGGVLFSSVKRGSGEVIDDTGRWFTLYGEVEWARLLHAAGFEVVSIEGEPPGESGTGSVAPGWISSIARLA